ncbi:hypothetical protein FHG87_005221 [Trinorchestia longiramus]|nr:hypothetical protein FHG87_005221 [Trinorchestia longiramus]
MSTTLERRQVSGNPATARAAPAAAVLGGKFSTVRLAGRLLHGMWGGLGSSPSPRRSTVTDLSDYFGGSRRRPASQWLKTPRFQLPSRTTQVCNVTCSVVYGCGSLHQRQVFSLKYFSWGGGEARGGEQALTLIRKGAADMGSVELSLSMSAVCTSIRTVLHGAHRLPSLFGDDCAEMNFCVWLDDSCNAEGGARCSSTTVAANHPTAGINLPFFKRVSLCHSSPKHTHAHVSLEFRDSRITMVWACSNV